MSDAHSGVYKGAMLTTLMSHKNQRIISQKQKIDVCFTTVSSAGHAIGFKGEHSDRTQRKNVCFHFDLSIGSENCLSLGTSKTYKITQVQFSSKKG